MPDILHMVVDQTSLPRTIPDNRRVSSLFLL